MNKHRPYKLSNDHYSGSQGIPYGGNDADNSPDMEDSS